MGTIPLLPQTPVPGKYISGFLDLMEALIQESQT